MWYDMKGYKVWDKKKKRVALGRGRKRMDEKNKCTIWAPVTTRRRRKRRMKMKWEKGWEKEDKGLEGEEKHSNREEHKDDRN